MPNFFITLLPLLGFMVVHLLGYRLKFLEGMPRSIWLSGAGGVSVAYVFLHLFPELQEGQAHVEKAARGQGLFFLEHHMYVMALVGLVLFYGIERLAINTRRGGKGAGDETPVSVFWVHMGSFALYNALIGYLLHKREEESAQEILFYWVAMALHFLVNDFGLREHHKERYQKLGRWLLVAALALGWGIGLLVEVSAAATALLLAFLAGGVILNVLKEELPEERESRFSAFLVGTAVYAALLLLL
ncbi:hypothetical protein ACD591_02110 [Rufibacter glacialis]|uniref:Zinc/iron permease n=1 Tax=Rufibacter glacialis TaxID=1259555 RepID=A0A5M8QI15_9BACT|nr:hypothetical protein [Rufibacter glacialis]KAA6435685.1 hypothetical protein FOE74_07010 [Rufibacter glacialis]GGK65620.1 hypothetical protein GCM10011405_12000 [Rufibacter glacialis]